MAIRDPGPPMAALRQVDEPTFPRIRRKVPWLGGVLLVMTLLLPAPLMTIQVLGRTASWTSLGPVRIPAWAELPLAAAWLASALLWVPAAIALGDAVIILRRLRRHG